MTLMYFFKVLFCFLLCHDNVKIEMMYTLFVVLASVNQLDNKTVKEGASVKLNCIVIGFPAPFVAWSKIGGGVISQDRWLNILNITKADRGQYQCFANNTCGSDVTFTSINVKCKGLKWITLR